MNQWEFHKNLSFLRCCKWNVLVTGKNVCSLVTNKTWCWGLCAIDHSIDPLGHRTLVIGHVTSKTSFVEVRLSRLWFQSVVKQTLIYWNPSVATQFHCTDQIMSYCMGNISYIIHEISLKVMWLVSYILFFISIRSENSFRWL